MQIERHGSYSRGRRIAFAAAVVLVGATVLAVVLPWRRPDPSLLQGAQQALADGNFESALHEATEYLRLAPDSLAARLCAAQAAQKLQRPDEALNLLRAIPDSASESAAADGLSLAAETCLAVGRASEAEAFLHRAIALRPDDPALRRQIVFLLTATGRRWESREHLHALVRLEQQTLEELILLGDPWPTYDLSTELDRFLAATPDDRLPLLGRARLAIQRNELPQAVGLLTEVLQRDPNLVEAHAWLGWCKLQDSRVTFTWAEWERPLPRRADEHPMIWLVRGLAADTIGQHDAALRCFWESARRDPNYELALFQLARALAARKRDSDAAALRTRTDQLYELAALLKRIHTDRNQLGRLPNAGSALRRCAELLERLGRPSEAQAWYGVLAKFDSQPDWAVEQQVRLARVIESERPTDSVDASPIGLTELARFPFPRWPRDAVASEPRRDRIASNTRFIDSASDAGIDFQYFNGDPPDDPRLLGTTGGGVGVIDYDGDSWPDLYFTQGCHWPELAGPTTYRDRLYRNLGDGRFQDVTLVAGLGDEHFSQGVAVGDFDNDGFPDIYLANLGPNRLYRNNGDGTFSDVAIRADILNEDWTTSCLMADVNGDGSPDLYEVNYVGGDALTRRCRSEGRVRPCSPYLFPAQDDRLFLNEADGHFRDVTVEAGIQGTRGLGLGIVAADFDGSRRLSLFVANDGTPNFFYRNESVSGAALPRFAEQGVLSGLAFDRFGNFQACMGVAADDANGDGALELFVTNFYQESNTFYVPETPGDFYLDRAAEFGLREGSLSKLGFGTQFIDGDLDGWPDLILTNGHVQDFRDQGTPYAMRAQFYRNVEGKRFVELPPEQLGPFFQLERLGRGLARVDWNRDGREDAVVSHVGAPAGLLTNQTDPAGHYLVLQLRGVQCARDAIGTTVRVNVGGRTLVRQLTAGDGYQASNQRQLVIGLGAAERVERLEIAWISGVTESFLDVKVDAEYVVVEGRGQLTQLPRAR